jgi:hypothetical protein
MDAPTAGTRLRCATCGTEIVVVKAPTEPITCCGSPMGAREAATAEGTADGQHAG